MELLNYINFKYKNINPIYDNSIPNCSITKIKIYCKKSNKNC
jgi:hypothetical protein